MIPRLCYMSDGERGTAGRALDLVIERLWRGGVGMVVLRENDASAAARVAWLDRLAPLREQGLRVLASRRLDLARALDLDGVHLAADAAPVGRAREWLGAEACIGYSAHTLEEARRAEREGASYVTLSPIYSTGSKPGAVPRGPGWLRALARDLEVPVLALGGITPSRVVEVLRAGAWGVAAVSALGGAPDPERAARAFAAELTERDA